MKTTIRDAGILSALSPVDVAAYLRNTGWARTLEIDGKASLWLLGDGEQAEDVLVPARRDLGDFAIRMGELLRALERVERRSQEEIHRDIQSTSSDLVRIRALDPRFGDGTLGMDAAVGFVEQSRELITAAACAAAGPRSYWARRKPGQAVDYLRRVRMGQTEIGSFVLTFHSPVAPSLRQDADLEEPFERRVTQTLTQALEAAASAARGAGESGDMGPFDRAIASGVSANLCDALAGLGQISQENGIEVSVTWSRTRPHTGPSRSVVRMPSDYVRLFQEASRLFKDSAPVDDFLLTGMVIGLDRQPGQDAGTVTVSAVVDNRPRRVLVELAGSDYDIAIRAHQESLPISCVGELVKEGRSLRLRAYQEFRLLLAED